MLHLLYHSVETASKKKFRLKAENISDTEILQKTR